jgi:hypothetical protein
MICIRCSLNCANAHCSSNLKGIFVYILEYENGDVVRKRLKPAVSDNVVECIFSVISLKTV